ncbi:MAG TPA: HIRAN domain-containing protein [Ignavibacteria bacterium]|nr:HIRAN domain-containing protein [Ignavibacteria bacterium]
MDRLNFIKLMSTSALLPSVLKNQLEQKNEKTIFLFNFYVAGYKYYKKPHHTKSLKPNDKLKLTLEPENKHDPSAIRIETTNKEKIGYIPMISNEVPYNLLKNDLTIKASIEEIDNYAPDWEKILVKLELKLII